MRDRPSAERAEELDLRDHFLLPGFIDSHAHIGTPDQAPSSDYVYRLWLAHGVTTVRELGAFNGLDWTLNEARRAAAQEIVAPKIHVYPALIAGMLTPTSPTSGDESMAWVREVAARGAKGVKFFGTSPNVFESAVNEASRLGLGSACHHDQRRAAQVNALTSARWGLGSIEHWYGIPEAMFRDRTVQHVPSSYNHNSEPERFSQGAQLWLQTAERGNAAWQETLEELCELGTTLSPTFNIYIGSRDAARVRTSEWHEKYTSPTLWQFFQPSPEKHGSYMGDWTTDDEIAWRHAYVKWMSFVNDFKNLGGRVTAGSDSGFIYKVYGFGFIEELELLQEAGFHPLEVIRAATLHGAELLGIDSEVGSIEVGKVADLVVASENPVGNFKVLYGNGHLRSSDNGVGRVSGVRFTMRSGVLYDAAELRADIAAMVAEEKAAQSQRTT
ncbi:amidohydrolase family protein [Brevibacterium sanguinis]|uniref:Amidohydrolase family protein n=3 Tax=Brevibacteriaceae TaxID=85019 RepID=A0A366IGH9_9MICO|nr:amidohydrolase family protein [Brevibacterium sanguinis]RBP70257.1 amidohydrolase family protein [Brevibacterium celere]